MSGLRDENDAEHYYNATVRLMAEVADLRAEVETWKQRARGSWLSSRECGPSRRFWRASVPTYRERASPGRSSSERTPISSNVR